MKAFLLVFLIFLCFDGLIAQACFPSEPSPKEPIHNEFLIFEPEPEPLNLDSVKLLIQHPGICAEGKVIVRVMLDTEGYYLQHIVLRTPHELWTASVVAVLPLLRFTPATMAGKPIKCWVTIPFPIK
jgi:hypothetical protein